MQIREYMTADPITVAEDTLLPEARRILNTYRIRHLPVIGADGRLAGIVTDRDLRSAYPSSVTTRNDANLSYEQVGKTVVADIMTTDCATLPPDATLDDALDIFDKAKVGGIPIIDEEEKIVGFLSSLDLLSAYRRLFGMLEKDSILVGVKDPGSPGILCDMTQLFAEHGISLARMIRLEEKGEGARIYMRLHGRSGRDVEMLLRERGFTVIDS